MNFHELEKLMADKGVSTLADIARTLQTTPQAVSNWKARDQVPHHIVAKIRTQRSSSLSQSSENPYDSSRHFEEETIAFSDIFLTLAKQVKVIIIVPIILIFSMYTFTWSTFTPDYESTSKILLPDNQANSGLANISSQFGINLQQKATTDLSSPSLIPELVTSFAFAERILEEKFYVEKYRKKLSLLSILTHGIKKPDVGKEALFVSAMSSLEGMILFKSLGSFSLITIKASEPKLARDINIKVLEALQNLNLYFKSRNVTEKVNFILSRIESVGFDLEDSEKNLKEFREQNRQISSPALQLEQERLSRDVEIQKGIFLTLKQELELANIEKIQNETIIQILDKPRVPLNSSGNSMRVKLILSGIVGLGVGILFAFIRSLIESSNLIVKRRIRHFIKKKAKGAFMDHRIYGIVGIMLLMTLPIYLSRESSNPIYFGMYSANLMLFNIGYILILILSLFLFFYLKAKNN